ncbi:glycerophosphodiester phosphodiesterase [Occultella glacieicola]|uniref:Glycerophosphodiester phosphodiesterase n=1 Tax=Occultella glacieicola TaxID=2518684 RepID=A0ABY2E270_9MICO|nr:glycerophosphodiester phosphodiesterase family protein [Occultella glacieicola]TDE91606.1 glycerophosphodiester phosphodiesterase [Occultella glacieicola]
MPITTSPLIIAHRGNSSVAPENTLPAFESAALGGSDLIEIDVQVSEDGVGIVIHDDTVDRTTDGSGPVAALRAAEVRHLDAGSWFAPAYSGTALPLFADVVEVLLRHRGLGLLLELKGAWPAEPTKLLLAEVTEAGIDDRVLVQGFSVEMLRTLQAVAPQLRRGLLISEFDDATLELAAELGVVALNPPATLILERPEVLARIHEAGLEAHVWTPNTAAEWAPLVDAGVDGIITDRPDRLTGWLAGR